MPENIPFRREVAAEYTWDADSIFPTVDAWEEAIVRADDMLVKLGAFKGQLGNGAETLLEWFRAYYKSLYVVQDVGQYAMMFSSVDTSDQIASARSSRCSALYARWSAAVSFAAPELLSLDIGTLDKWMSESKDLAVYRHYFDVLQTERPHIRSAEVEQLLGQVQEPFSAPWTIHSMLSDAEIKFRPATDSAGKDHEVIQPTIHTLLASPDRALRKAAWESYADGYLEHKNSLAACLSSGVRQDVFMARARNYPSALEASLHGLQIPIEVYHGVIDAFKDNLHVWHRYFDVVRRALKVDRLHVYDVKAPFSTAQPVVTYPQAIDWICHGMLPLGDDYVEAMRKGLVTDRWVDVYPNRGKNMGAYSSGHQGTRPFIFMSYNDSLFGMSTLAHELGHSMHSYLAWQNQLPVYAGCGSEVPSNFNQAMTRAYLFDTVKDRDFQIALIEEAIANFHRYFLIMPTIARFELEIHSTIEHGGALTADGLNSLMCDLFTEAMGDAVQSDPDRLGITWAQFPTHVYGNIFMFLYTVGIAGAHALAEPILAGEAGSAEKYLTYLKSGGSAYELDLLKTAGVDMTTPEPVVRTFKVLEKLIDRLEALTS